MSAWQRIDFGEVLFQAKKHYLFNPPTGRRMGQGTIWTLS